MASAAKIAENDRTGRWKFILRLLAILLAAGGIGFLGWDVGRHHGEAGCHKDGEYNDRLGASLGGLVPVSEPLLIA